MRRRSLLTALVVGTTGAVAGCFGASGPVEQKSIEICDSECDWAEKTPDAGEEPIVERYPEERRVLVYGNMYVGSGSCDRAVLDAVEVTDDSLRIVVGVGDRGDNPMGGCTADMSPDQYRVTVRLREPLPERVVVEEDAAWDPSETPTDG